MAAQAPPLQNFPRFRALFCRGNVSFVLIVMFRARLFLFPVDCSLFPLHYPLHFRTSARQISISPKRRRPKPSPLRKNCTLLHRAFHHALHDVLLREDVEDDDGQHPADQIYTIVDKLTEGYDLVYAKFPHQKQSLMRRCVSKIHTALQESIGAKPKGIVNSSFLGWSRFSIDTLKSYHSPFVSAGSFLLKSTTRITNVDVQHRERMSGHSGYTLKKLINLELTELTNFSNVPLRFCGALGAFSTFAGILLGIILIIRKIISSNFSIGYTSVIVLLLVLCGLILLSLGLMGEYIGKIYMTISNQPQYSVREIVNGRAKSDAIK